MTDIYPANHTPIMNDDWALRRVSDNSVVFSGDVCTSFRGEPEAIYGGSPPHKPSSTGRVYTDNGEFFPSVFNLKWTPKHAN